MTSPDSARIIEQHTFYDQHFTDANLDHATIEHKVFEHCLFEKCSFIASIFRSCKFIDCEFKSCNLSTAQLIGSSFNETVFVESKVIGINWTQIKWPLVKLNSPIKFYQSNISDCSFYELDLSEIVIEGCKVHDVDFREADLSHGCFIASDFTGSLFMHTNLYAADFIEAINYTIHPGDNTIRKAKFSLPDAINLLNGFDIEIQ